MFSSIGLSQTQNSNSFLCSIIFTFFIRSMITKTKMSPVNCFISQMVPTARARAGPQPSQEPKTPWRSPPSSEGWVLIYWLSEVELGTKLVLWNKMQTAQVAASRTFTVSSTRRHLHLHHQYLPVTTIPTMCRHAPSSSDLTLLHRIHC